MKKRKNNILFKNINFFNKYLLITVSILIVITSGIVSYAAFSLQLSGNQNISIKIKDYKLPEVLSVITARTGTVANPKVTISAQVRDNVGIVGYQVTESNIAPTNNWTTITSSKSRTISKDVSVAKTYYFWVKDQAGNVSITKSLTVIASELDYFSDCFAYTETTTEATITEYKCYAGNTYGYPTITDVTIPTKLNNKNVVAIADYEEDTATTFHQKGITKVTLPNTLKTIGEHSFRANNIAGPLTIPASVTIIGTSAFQDNKLTGTLIIPASVVTIGDGAFHSGAKNTYNKLTGLTFQSGSNLTSIGYSAFRNNNIGSLSTFNYLTKLQTIGEHSFRGNNLIGKLEIPASVTTIGTSAFDSSTKNTYNQLTELTFQSTNNNLISIGSYAFFQNNINKMTNFDKLTKLQTIGESAFRDNNLSETLTIPTSVTTIEFAAFASSDKASYNKLTGLTFQSGSNLTSIGDAAFENNSINSLSFSNLTKLQTIGNETFEDNNLTEPLTIPVSVTTIGDRAFWSTTSNTANQLRGLIFRSGSNLTIIGEAAFYRNNINTISGFNYLTKLQTIGNSAFHYNNLTSIFLPTGLKTIGDFAFYGNLLSSLTIPNTVTSIGSYAFYINQLTSVTIPNSVTSIGAAAFNANQLPDLQAFIYKRNSNGTEDKATLISYGGTKRTGIVIPAAVKTIGPYAFRNTGLIPSITIPSTVTTIGESAFLKSSTTNQTLTKIINTTGRTFDWGLIINGTSNVNYIKPTVVVVNSTGNVSVTDS